MISVHLGDRILYRPTGTQMSELGSKPLPAIVVEAHGSEDGRVNAQVFLNHLPSDGGGSRLITNIVHGDQPGQWAPL